MSSRRSRQSKQNVKHVSTTIDDDEDEDIDAADTPVMVLDAPPVTATETSRPFDRPITHAVVPESMVDPTPVGPSPREVYRQKMQLLRNARTRGIGVRSTQSSQKHKETKKMANQYMQDPDAVLRSLGVQDDSMRELLKQAMDRGDINDVKKIAASLAQSIPAGAAEAAAAEDQQQ